MKAIGKAPNTLDAFVDLGRSFRMWYERIIPSFAFSSGWWVMGFIAAQLVLLVATPLMFIPAALIWALASLSTMVLANRFIHMEDFDIRWFMASSGRLIWRFIGLFILSIAAFLLYLPLLLYLPTQRSIIAFMGFGIASWVGLFSLVTVIYAAGIMTERDERLFKSILKGFLLMIDNPAYSLTVGMLALVLAGIGYIIPIASMTWSSWAYLVFVIMGAFLYGSVNAYFISYATRRLLSRYGLDRKGGREAMQEQLKK